jgi:hypothetical protein
MDNYNTPILLLVFNRPDKVRKLIARLAEIKPAYLYISADGPRANVPGDQAKCEEVRDLFSKLPWECEIHTNFSEKNLGCMNGPVTGITWFFEHVTEGIILEDDCIPHPSFFPFVTKLLSTYEHDDRIMHISGTSFLTSNESTPEMPYYFSKIAHGWGWATWRRAWAKFDISMSNIPKLEQKLTQEKTFLYKKHATFWTHLFKYVQRTAPLSGIWDAQWEYSVLLHDGICITPTINLVENVGFDSEATHTKDKPDSLVSTGTLTLETQHISEPVISRDIDAIVMERAFKKSFKHRISSVLKGWFYSLPMARRFKFLP